MPLSELPPPLEEETGRELPQMRVAPPGPHSTAAALRLQQVECPAFSRRRQRRSETSGADMAPIVLSHGMGSNLHDVDGNRYVDLAAGFGSMLLGHGSPGVARAIDAQGERLMQGLGDVYAADVKLGLLERLASLHPGLTPQVILAQSGSDAVTAAIKTAALATGKPGLVAFEGAYHGLGYAPLAACGLRESYRAPFADQLNTHVTFAPYARSAADLDRALSAVEAALAKGDVGAVLIEPILGRGGCVVPPDAFIHGVCEAAHRHGALVIADEIWTGIGRSGAMVRTSAIAAKADILCFGKGLGGGLPISACVAPEAIMRAWGDAENEVIHTSTHAGAPLACAAAVATLDTVRFRQLAQRAAEVGGRARDVMASELSSLASVVDVRGEGLMIGIELASGEQALAATRGMLAKGYLLLGGGVRGEVLTLTPALTIAEAQLGGAASALREVLSA